MKVSLLLLFKVLLLVFSSLALQAQGFQGSEMIIDGKTYILEFNYTRPIQDSSYGSLTIYQKAHTLMHQPRSNPNMIEYPCSPYEPFSEDDPDFLKKNDFQEMKFLQNAFVKVLGMERINQFESNRYMGIRLYIDDMGKVKEIAFYIPFVSIFPLVPADIPKLEEEILKMQFTVDPECKELNYFLLGFDIDKSKLLSDWTWRK